MRPRGRVGHWLVAYHIIYASLDERKIALEIWKTSENLRSLPACSMKNIRAFKSRVRSSRLRSSMSMPLIFSLGAFRP